MAPVPPAGQLPPRPHERSVLRPAIGEPVDPEAIYFVLRLDSEGDDFQHIAACRAAARKYIERIEQLRTPWLQQTAQELRALLDKLDGIVCRKGYQLNCAPAVGSSELRRYLEAIAGLLRREQVSASDHETDKRYAEAVKLELERRLACVE